MVRSSALGLNSQTVSGRRIVVARLPVRLIPAGDYIVDLRGTGPGKDEEESVESYSFRVVHKTNFLLSTPK